MSQHVEFRHCALTDKGMVRAQNEDALAVLPEVGVAILADGMGGYRAGEVASRIAVETCSADLQRGLQAFDWDSSAERSVERSERLAEMVSAAIGHANATIFDTARNQPECAGMGTTLVVTLLHHDKLIVAHIGDSRAYRVRDGQLEQITRDHSQVQDQVDAGLLSPQQARVASNRNMVTRALGIERSVQGELNRFTTRPADLYLLCSDGLSDMVEDTEIAEILSASGNDLERAGRELVARANALGGVDNISVVLLRIDAIATENPGLLGRMLDWVR